MKKTLSILTTIAYLITFSGCASIVSGKSADLTVHSNPGSASVYIDDMPIGKTPLVTDVKRKKEHEIKITKEGYEEYVITTKRGCNWWILGDFALLSILGLIIDLATGAAYSVKPDEINVQLKEKSNA
jgi:hypothetical protein